VSAQGWGHHHRFFVEPSAIEGQTVRFTRDQSHQLTRVLRIGEDEPVIVLTGDRLEHLVQIVDASPKACLGAILDSRDSADHPGPTITLYQAFLPRERFEQALSKSTEIGISGFVPIRTQRTVAKIDERDWPGRSERLTSIAREAAEQSERARVPQIGPPMSFPSAIDLAVQSGVALVACERGKTSITRDELARVANGLEGVSLFIGPEGGFTEEEIALAASRGAMLVWLGPRILRAETAGPILTALLLHEAGDMGIRP
jgi:16S rRNA (uracil1498-N3)-methyltransferase